MIYGWIGRTVVGLVRWRYRRQIRIAIAIGIATGLAAAVGGYLAATRNVPEG